jgi:hypothetical protein
MSQPEQPVDGAALLNRLRAALLTYLVMPSEHATVAVVLWIAATHAQPAWAHATRLCVTGPERRCGKTRLLEIAKATVHKPLPAVNASTAALYRSIDPNDPPTVLFDDVDTIFGTKKVSESNEELRGLLNAGHSRGWPVLRCIGPNQEVQPFNSFAMAALAGIGNIPDTITDRAVNIHMRRRAPHERVKPFRERRDSPALITLGGELAEWVNAQRERLSDAEPDMPIEDRAADTWEPLIAIADLAGGDWPEHARLAAKTLTDDAAERDVDNNAATRLLADLRSVFTAGDGGVRLYTSTIVERLTAIENSPWADTPPTAHDLSRMLRPYGVRPKDLREPGGPVRKGYEAADLQDPWSRYLQPHLTGAVAGVADRSATPQHGTDTPTSDVAVVADVAAPEPAYPTLTHHGGAA